MNKDYTYKCPHCKKEQDVIIEFNKATIKYNYCFETDTWEQRDVIYGEHENFACYGCGEDLPIELEKEIFDQI